MRKITHFSLMGVSLFYYRRRHRVDRRQEIRDQSPAITAIMAGEYLACVGADIHSTGIQFVGTHPMTQNAQTHSLARWQTLGQGLPLLAAILGAIHGKLLSHIVTPIWVLHHYEDGIRVMVVQRDRETEFGGQVLLDVNPIVASVEALVDAAMVLLV